MRLLLPPHKRDSADLTHRGANQRRQFLWKCLEKNNLVDKAFNSPFASLFYMVKDNVMPHLLVHNLLLRQVDTSLSDELQVLLGSTICHFGIREFGLLTGLKLAGDDIPADFEIPKGNGSFLHRVFQDSPKVKVNMIFCALSGNHSNDDMWRLCLCYLIEGILYGREDSNEVWRGMLYLVEDLDIFFEFPWGKRIFEVTMSSICEANVPEMYVGKRKRKRPKYTIHGAVLVLCFWALEIVPQLSTVDFVTRTTISGFPRLQRWKIDKMPSYKTLSNIFDIKKLKCKARLAPCDEEEEVYVKLYHLDVPTVSIHDTHLGHDGRMRAVARDVGLSDRESDTDYPSDGHSDHFDTPKRHDDSLYVQLEDRVSFCEKTQKRLDQSIVQLKRMVGECKEKNDESSQMFVEGMKKHDESMQKCLEALKKHDESLRLACERQSMFSHLNNGSIGTHVGMHGNGAQPLYNFSAHDYTSRQEQESQLPGLGHRSEYHFQASDPILNQAQLFNSDTTRPTHMPMMEHNFLTPTDGRVSCDQASQYRQAMAQLMDTTENAEHVQRPVSPLPFNLGCVDPTPDPTAEYIDSMPFDDHLTDVPVCQKKTRSAHSATP